MRVRCLMVGILGVAVLVGRAAAQESCETHVVAFPKDSTSIDLDAEATVSRIVGWLLAGSGRYAVITPAGDSWPAEVAMGEIRAFVVARHMEAQGVSAAVLLVLEPDAIPRARRQAALGRGAVIVTTCFGLPPPSDDP